MTDLSSAEKRYTEKEMIEAQRKSFAASYEWVLTKNYTSPAVIEREAFRRYPDPKEPTIVTAEDGQRFQIFKGGLYKSAKAGEPWTWVPDYPLSLLLALGEIAQESISNTQDKPNG